SFSRDWSSDVCSSDFNERNAARVSVAAIKPVREQAGEYRWLTHTLRKNVSARILASCHTSWMCLTFWQFNWIHTGSLPKQTSLPASGKTLVCMRHSVQ